MVALATDGLLVRIAGLFTLAVAVGYGLYAMLPLFLVAEHGMERSSANTLVGLSRALAPPMIMGAGWLADRLGHRRALAIFQAITGGLTIVLALVREPETITAIVVLQAAASTCFFPAYYPLVTQIVPPAQRHLAISVVSIAGMLLGGGLTPSAIGFVAEAHSFTGAILCLGILTAASPALLWTQRKGFKRDERPAAGA
jgi:NNP family nitrate/nitrite transporter-like MFS transporter